MAKEWIEMSPLDWRDYTLGAQEAGGMEHALAQIGLHSNSGRRSLIDRVLFATNCPASLNFAIEKGLVVEVSVGDGVDTVARIIRKTSHGWSGDGDSAPSSYGRGDTHWYQIETVGGAEVRISALLYLRNFSEMLVKHIGEESPFERELEWTQTFKGSIRQDDRERWHTFHTEQVPHARHGGDVYYLSSEEVDALLARTHYTRVTDGETVYVISETRVEISFELACTECETIYKRQEACPNCGSAKAKNVTVRKVYSVETGELITEE